MPVGTSQKESFTPQIDSSGRVHVVTITGNVKNVAEVLALPKLKTVYLTNVVFDADYMAKSLASTEIETLQIGPNASNISQEQLRAIGSIPTLKMLTLYTSDYKQSNEVIKQLNRTDLNFNAVVQKGQQALIWKRVGPIPDFVDLPVPE